MALLSYKGTKRLFWSGLLITVITGCAASTTSSSNSSDVVRSHMVQSTELKHIMSSLYYDMYTEEGNINEINTFRTRHAFKLIEALELMAVEIKSMDGVIVSNEKQVFDVYATRLRFHANEIREIVAEMRMDELTGAVDRVIESCEACHTLIRK